MRQPQFLNGAVACLKRTLSFHCTKTDAVSQSLLRKHNFYLLRLTSPLFTFHFSLFTIKNHLRDGAVARMRKRDVGSRGAQLVEAYEGATCKVNGRRARFIVDNLYLLPGYAVSPACA